MRDAYIAALYELAKKDERILALVADNGAIVYDQFRRDFPERFINFGIAEATMVSVAAGLACCGRVPFCYTIASFLTMRSFEQIRNDVCMQKMNVKLAGIGCGFVYSNLGPTHHATKDITLMRSLPEMTVISPCSPMEAKKATYAAASIDGPVYLRLSVGGTPEIYKEDYDFKVGRGVTLRDGKDIAIISTGGIILEAQAAAEELKRLGISARLINIHTIKPVDTDIILKAAAETKAILTVEEHSILGGLGSSVAEVLLENGAGAIKFRRMGLNGVFASGYGSYQDMKEENGLTAKDITACAKKLLRA